MCNSVEISGCENLGGGFTCSCVTGYSVADDGITCTGTYSYSIVVVMVVAVVVVVVVVVLIVAVVVVVVIELEVNIIIILVKAYLLQLLLALLELSTILCSYNDIVFPKLSIDLCIS